MFRGHSNRDETHRRFNMSGTRPNYNPARRDLTPQQIAKLIFEHPELRLAHDPSSIQLAQMLAADPEDPDIQEILGLIVGNKYREFIISGDVFWGNYPPKGGITYPPDFMALGDMPIGDPTGLVRSQLTGNVSFLGPTRSAKTTLLSMLLSYPELLKSTRLIAFVKKPELRDLTTDPDLHDLITVFKLAELALSYFQPPSGVPELAWRNESTRIIAQNYARYSAQRLMGEKVGELMADHPEGTYPTLRQVAEVLNDFIPRFGLREAAYRESMLWCLTDLLNCTGKIFDYSASDFLEHLFSVPGLAIIELKDLPQEHFTLIVTYFMRWLYFKRLYASRG